MNNKIEKFCEQCLSLFVPLKYSHQKFCSKTCKERARNKRRLQNPEYRQKNNKRRKERYNKNKAKQYNKNKVSSGCNVYYKINLRCNNSNASGYKYYGGKDIKNLLTKKEFLEIYWSVNTCALCHCELNDNDRHSSRGRSVDRINNDDHYNKENIQIICLSCNAKKNKIIEIPKAIELEEMYNTKNMTANEIGKYYGCHNRTVYNWLKMLDIKAKHSKLKGRSKSIKEIKKICEGCLIEFIAKYQKQRFCSKLCWKKHYYEKH